MNQLQNLPELLFSPLGKDYCLYFYIISVIAFLLLVSNVIMVVSKSLKNKGKGLIFDLITLTPIPLVLYFQNRLFYSMCMN